MSEMAIYCPEGYSFSIHDIRTQLKLGRRSVWLQSCCPQHDFRMRDVLLTVLIDIVNEEKCATRRLLLTGFVEQVLSVLNAAEIVLGEEHQRSLIRYIWHYWDHPDEPLRSRCFGIFRLLLLSHGKNCFLNSSNEVPVTSAQPVDPVNNCSRKDCQFLKIIFETFLSSVGTIPYVYKFLTFLFRFSGIEVGSKKRELLWNKIIDDMSKNNTYAVNFYVALAEADLKVNEKWCDLWIEKLLYDVYKNYDDAASWYRIFTKVFPKLFQLKDYSKCCDAVRRQIIDHFRTERLADHCIILYLCLVKHELPVNGASEEHMDYYYYLLKRALFCGNTMIVDDALEILIENVQFGSRLIYLLPALMGPASFFALYACKSDRQSMLARLKNLLIRIRSMVNEVHREDSESEHCHDLEMLSTTVRQLFRLSTYFLNHCIQYSTRHFALEILKILVDLSFFQVPVAEDDDNVWKEFQLEWNGEPSVALFDCLLDRFEENRNLALELFRTVPYEIRVQFKLRGNVQWMDFLSSNKILHGGVAMTLLEFSFFQNSVSALMEKKDIYVQFLHLAQRLVVFGANMCEISNLINNNSSIVGIFGCFNVMFKNFDLRDLTQFNGGNRTILVEVCKVGVHVAELLLPAVTNKVRVAGGVNFTDTLSSSNNDLEEATSVWRFFKQLSEYLALLSEMLLQSDDFSPEVEDDINLIRIICYYFRTLVFSCHHCGVLETSSDPFRRFCRALRRSKYYFTYPLHWIDEIMAEFQNDQLSSNISRKSAGLPYLITGCLSSLVYDSVEEGMTVFDFVMSLLLEKCTDSNSLTTTKIHCCNVMRVLFREAQFRQACIPHLRKGMITAFYTMGDHDWSVRNSANYLFSVLLTRIFGPAKKRSRTNSTNGNYMSDACDATVTSKQSDFHFFSTFYGLDHIMLELLEQCLLGSWNQSNIGYAFSVLTVLTHLYPFKSHYCVSPDSTAYDGRLKYLMKFWSPVFRILLTCPVMHLRQLAASALVSTVPFGTLLRLIDTSRQFITSIIRTSSQNAINGFLHLAYLAINKYSNHERLSKVIAYTFRENKEFLDLDLVRKNCYENISMLMTLLCDGNIPIESSVRNIFVGLSDLVAHSPAGCSLRRTFVRWAVTMQSNMEIAWPIITVDENFRIELWTVVEQCPDLHVTFNLKVLNVMITDLMNTNSEALIHKTVNVLYKRCVGLYAMKHLNKELFWISFSRRYDAVRSLRSRTCLFLFACMYLPSTATWRWANNIMTKLIDHILKECCEGDEIVVDEFLFDALRVFLKREDHLQLKHGKPWLILLDILFLSTDSDSRYRAAQLCYILDKNESSSEIQLRCSVSVIAATDHIVNIIAELDETLLLRLVRTVLSSFCRIIGDRIKSDMAPQSSFYKDDLNKLFEPVWALEWVMRVYNENASSNQSGILWVIDPTEVELSKRVEWYFSCNNEFLNALIAYSQLISSRGRHLAINDHMIRCIIKAVKRMRLPQDVSVSELSSILQC